MLALLYMKVLFSIATIPRCRGECYPFPWIALLIMLEASNTIF